MTNWCDYGGRWRPLFPHLTRTHVIGILPILETYFSSMDLLSLLLSICSVLQITLSSLAYSFIHLFIHSLSLLLSLSISQPVPMRSIEWVFSCLWSMYSVRILCVCVSVYYINDRMCLKWKIPSCKSWGITCFSYNILFTDIIRRNSIYYMMMIILMIPKTNSTCILSCECVCLCLFIYHFHACFNTFLDFVLVY